MSKNASKPLDLNADEIQSSSIVGSLSVFELCNFMSVLKYLNEMF